MKSPVMLVILDGFGHQQDDTYNAIQHANTPHLSAWLQKYPHAFLQASGTAVGLPEGCIGNSEVGHITIGAGRVIEQPATILNNAIASGSLYRHPLLQKKLNILKQDNGRLHIIGLLSTAYVHGHHEHISAFLKIAAQLGIKRTYLHLILDGRDMLPQSAIPLIKNITALQKQLNYGVIGSIHGRFYAMDRDQNWDRTEKSYTVLTQPQPPNNHSWQEIIETSYTNHITDEFIVPTQLDQQAIVQNNDGIIFCNWRSERAWQLTAPFVDPAFNHFQTKKIPLSFFITPTNYHHGIKTTVLLKQQPIAHTLKDVLALHHKTIFSIAESEKFAHVTYFFRAEHEGAVMNEIQQQVPSKKTIRYDSIPDMSAPTITHHLITSLQTDPADFYLVNYANADMVGHSGNFQATVKAIECLDKQLVQLYSQVVLQMHGTLLITADHGKAELMFDKHAHQPRTAHTNNPVPFICIDNSHDYTNDVHTMHELADIAPFILRIMHLTIPQEMINKRVF